MFICTHSSVVRKFIIDVTSMWDDKYLLYKSRLLKIPRIIKRIQLNLSLFEFYVLFSLNLLTIHNRLGIFNFLNILIQNLYCNFYQNILKFLCTYNFLLE